MIRNAPAAASGGSWCNEIVGGVRLALQVMPNAKKSQIIGPFDGVLKLRLQAQPVKGHANQALLGFLAGLLDVPRSRISISHGFTNKRKVVEILGTALTAEAVMCVLLSGVGQFRPK